MPQEVQAHQPGAEQRNTHQAARIETLVQEIAAFSDPQARATAQELVQAILEMYGEGLSRLLEITAETDASGLELIDTFAGDELLSSLFLLHGLHPLDIETRVRQALDEVRPYLKSHGGNVEFVKVEDSIAYLRLEGSCHGCPGSTITLKLAIEEAIYKAAPDLNGLQVEGVTEPPPRASTPIAFVPRQKHKDALRATKQDRGGWTVVEGLHSLSPGILKVITIQKEPLLFCQIADTYYAYLNRCSNCEAPLDSSTLEGTQLRCSSCERQYDLSRAGRSMDASALFLEPVPLLVEGGKVKVALSSQAILAAQSR
jgi:Fe-S cluster biogenesis protein NfuA/nitrite reductase/ring-hydroxylating ferredoxin subunit